VFGIFVSPVRSGTCDPLVNDDALKTNVFEPPEFPLTATETATRMKVGVEIGQNERSWSRPSFPRDPSDAGAPCDPNGGPGQYSVYLRYARRALTRSSAACVCSSVALPF
jgi:hypothetical protein